MPYRSPKASTSGRISPASAAPPHSVGVTNIPVLAGGGWPAAIARCPKHMAHGPRAGVRADGSCEVAGAGRCPYLDVPDQDWPYRDTGAKAGAGAPLAATSRPEPRSRAAMDFLATAVALPARSPGRAS